MVAVSIVCGLGLRLVQFLANRSIYIDEAALGLNLRDRSFVELASGPLDFAQTGPLGLLFGQKLLLQILGEHELVLRLIPFAASMLSVPLFIILARRYVAGPSLAAVGAVYALSFPLVYFAADAKPYAVDVLFTMLVLLIGSRLLERPTAPAVAVTHGLFGGVVMWLSQPVILVFGGLAILLLRAESRRPGGIRLPTLAMTAGWAVSGVASIMVSARMLTAEQRAYMHDFWAPGFMPLLPRNLAEFFWLPVAAVRVGSDVLGSSFPVILTFLLLSGLLVLFRRTTTDSALVLLPIGLALATSAAGQYPFGGDHGALPGRTLLFLVPCFLIAVGSGLQDLMTRLPKWIFVTMIGAIAVGNALPLARSFPMARDEIRPVLEYIVEQRRDGDLLYIYYGARHAFEWYAPSMGLHDMERIDGTCARATPERYAADVARIPPRGRSWLVISHAVAREPRLLAAQFQRRGTELARVVRPGAAALLFDMEQLPADSAAAPAAYDTAADGFLMLVGCRGLYEWF
jgi:hypothetical protein